jgi:hypothetical protein
MAELKPKDYIVTLTPNAYSAKDGGKVVFSATNIRPLIRCKDCEHYDARWRRCFFGGKLSDIHVIENGYCWRAERRADNG